MKTVDTCDTCWSKSFWLWKGEVFVISEALTCLTWHHYVCYLAFRELNHHVTRCVCFHVSMTLRFGLDMCHNHHVETPSSILICVTGEFKVICKCMGGFSVLPVYVDCITLQTDAFIISVKSLYCNLFLCERMREQDKRFHLAYGSGNLRRVFLNLCQFVISVKFSHATKYLWHVCRLTGSYLW